MAWEKILKEIGIIGVGYVGLPLAINLSKFFNVTAFDKDKNRVIELTKGQDKNNEHSRKELTKKNFFLLMNIEN